MIKSLRVLLIFACFACQVPAAYAAKAGAGGGRCVAHSNERTVTVRMPDGEVVVNVPASCTQEELLSRAKRNSVDVVSFMTPANRVDTSYPDAVEFRSRPTKIRGGMTIENVSCIEQGLRPNTSAFRRCVGGRDLASAQIPAPANLTPNQQTCSGYGFKFGTVPFAQCVLQLDQMKQLAEYQQQQFQLQQQQFQQQQ